MTDKNTELEQVFDPLDKEQVENSEYIGGDA